MKPHLDVKLTVTIPEADFIAMASGFLDLLISDSQYAGRWAVNDMKILEAIVREVRDFYTPRVMGRGQQDQGDTRCLTIASARCVEQVTHTLVGRGATTNWKE